MSQSYLKIQQQYLERAWARPQQELEQALSVPHEDDRYRFRAFGQQCELSARDITLDGTLLSGPEGILIALYAAHVAAAEPVQLEPLKSYKELPNTGPYQAAFTANAEHILVPHTAAIQRHQDKIIERYSGHPNPDAPSGDFSFTLYPLPKVPLFYIFHLADDDFPAAVTCLFASNATAFMPVDGLADVAEYTAKGIIPLVSSGSGR